MEALKLRSAELWAGLTVGISSTWKCSCRKLQVLHGHSSQHNTVLAVRLVVLYFILYISQYIQYEKDLTDGNVLSMQMRNHCFIWAEVKTKMYCETKMSALNVGVMVE